MTKKAGVKEAQPKSFLTGRDLAKILLGSALAGFGIRGAVGLGKLFKRRITKPEATPEPALPEEKERKKLQPKAAMEKEAIDPFVGTVLGTALGAGGAYGGWRLADYLFDKRRLEDTRRRVDKAKKEYEKMLLGRDMEPEVQFRLPKAAAYIERAAELYEKNGTAKQAGLSEILAWLPYIGTAGLTALVSAAALKSYGRAKAESPIERRLEAFGKRPRYRPVPARAYLSEPRPTAAEAQVSATKLPRITETKLKEEERVKEPGKEVSAASILLSA